MSKIRVVCLPIAGIGNPYQKLMMEGLRSRGLQVQHGEPGKFLALLISAFKYRPDYIHLDWLHSYYLRRREWMTWVHFPFFLFQVFIIRNVLGVKLVWTLHNIFPHDNPMHGPHKWARQFFANQCEWIRVFDKNTILKAADTLKVAKSKFRVVPEGSYIGYYKNSVSPTEARKKLNLPIDKRIVLYLGLIKPYKGVLELIEAFNECQLPNTLLLITGKSMDSDYFEKITSAGNDPDIIICEGFVSDYDLQFYFNASDVTVLPFNKIENSGSAILAMGFKKPIIAPRKGVLKHRLAQQDILLYEVGQLKNALLKSDSLNSEELKDLGEKNYNVLSKHTWEDFGSRCFVLGKESLKNHKN